MQGERDPNDHRSAGMRPALAGYDRDRRPHPTGAAEGVTDCA